MRKKLFAGVLAACAAVCMTVAGCAAQATQEELDRLQGGVTIENPPHENEYLAGITQDAGMTVDGILDEDVWQDNGTAWTFEHDSSTEDNPVTMTTMSHLGENGLYVAFDVKDTAIYYSSDRRASGNTSVEIYVGAFEATEWDGNSFRVSVVPTGSDSCLTEVRTYRTKTAVYEGADRLNAEWALWEKALIAGCHIEGAGINTSFNEGYSIELFIPWAQLGLSATPEAVQYMTAFYHVESEASDADNVWSKCEPNVSTTALGSWLVAAEDEIGTYTQMADKLLTEADDYMTVDGVFDEDVWDLSGEFVYEVDKPANSVYATVGTTAYFSEKGVYLAVRVRDSEIYATPARAINLNTGLEIWVQAADATCVTADSVELRIDALGSVAKYNGRENNEFASGYFKSLSAVRLLGCEQENGVIASDSATGFDAEIFIPYEELGLTEKPESLAVYPQYVHAEDIENTVKPGSNSDVWSFWQISSQSTAKRDSRNAFARLTDGGYLSELSADDILFNAADLASDGSYSAEMTVERQYAGTLLNCNVTVLPAAVSGAVSATEGVTLTANGSGYTIAFTPAFVSSIDESAAVKIRAGEAELTLTAVYLPVVFDGAVTGEDEYASLPVGFHTIDSNGYEAGATVYTTASGNGVAVAIVMDADYINVQGNAQGNNGGGIEIRMAASPTAETGLWWRIFADGTARTQTDLTQGAPSQARTDAPVGSEVFEVGVVPNDAEDPTKGYNRLTVEFYVPYAAVGAASAEDFYLAIGLFATRKSDNGTLRTVWMDGTCPDPAVPTQEGWLCLADLASAQLTDQSVNAFFGEASFRMNAAFSEYVYFTGVEFTGGGAVIEEEYGTYTYTMSGTGEETLTARCGGSSAKVTFVYTAPPVSFDGVVDAKDGYENIPYTFYAVNSKEMEVTVYVYYDDDGAAIALVMDSPYINYGTAATGNNGGGFELRMANATDAETGLWWRTFADGTVRTNTNLTQGAPSTDRTKTPAGSLAFEVGLVPNDAEDPAKGYKQMTAEFYVPYSAVGATDAEDFFLAVGANATKDDNTSMGVRWMDGSGSTVPAAQNFLTLSAIGAAQPADATVEAPGGRASFKIGSALSPYVYYKGADFGESDVTESAFGEYEYTMSATENETITAVLGKSTVSVTVKWADVAVVYDGAVTGEDAYEGLAYSVKATNRNDMTTEMTVHVLRDVRGVSFALVMEADYINFGTNETGNNGGGVEIRMAASPTAETGLWWRVFADGTARTNTNLTQNAPSQERTETPVGSLAFEVGVVPNDASDLSKGYNRMTVEFYVPYAAVGASDAEDFWFAFGQFATNQGSNTSSWTVWADGTMPDPAVPTQESWFLLSDVAGADLADASVTAYNGAAAFRVGAAFSPYVYYKGVSFTGGEVSEGAYGVYTCTMSAQEPQTLTASLGESTAQIALGYRSVSVPALDGTVGESEYEHSISFSTVGFGNSDSDFATVVVSWTVAADAVYFAFDVTENAAAYTTNTGSGNQGSAGVNFVVSKINLASADYYRAWASGAARTYMNFNGNTFGAPNAYAASLDYMAGSHTIAQGGDRIDNITRYALEWKISYSDYGVSGADELYFLFGWINGGQADRAYGKVSGMSNVTTNTACVLHDFSEYFSIADLLALEAQQAEREA